jgi:DNA-binding NtrC family response regulator
VNSPGRVDIRDASLNEFVTHDPAMQACLDRARLAARTDLPVLILGESGTGKTLVARAIHNSSQLASEIAQACRAQRPSIVGLDRAAADQLFGYRWPGNLRELSKVVPAAPSCRPSRYRSCDSSSTTSSCSSRRTRIARDRATTHGGAC